MDMKSNQWFGATVRSSGEDGIVLVSQLTLSVKRNKLFTILRLNLHFLFKFLRITSLKKIV